jgi:hypothetical protein
MFATAGDASRAQPEEPAQVDHVLTVLQARWAKFALKDKRKTHLSSLEELRQMISPANIT